MILIDVIHSLRKHVTGVELTKEQANEIIEFLSSLDNQLNSIISKEHVCDFCSAKPATFHQEFEDSGELHLCAKCAREFMTDNYGDIAPTGDDPLSCQ